ncbi:uncharacterized protein CC84DRAFT_1168103 [Paraphaeosphaeria sporulosa]|uniref:Uncharacterized protein n=1 Tax=Paraphaeosphaeria sporulosa TaxID=1460663 RepID=A0A177BZT0_9PLEO|nr:uncharacterized protein CC84DRAFT_1168103 [Paraphaeosphaeria sporulosa]OAG00883.1 hypothetical protein CC84DRAFT_1168103 [Paraphaeosphaeria sporulosa]
MFSNCRSVESNTELDSYFHSLMIRADALPAFFKNLYQNSRDHAFCSSAHGGKLSIPSITTPATRVYCMMPQWTQGLTKTKKVLPSNKESVKSSRPRSSPYILQRLLVIDPYICCVDLSTARRWVNHTFSSHPTNTNPCLQHVSYCFTGTH